MANTRDSHVVRHHIDRRARQLIAQAGAASPDDLLDTTELADWLGVSIPWIEIGRLRGYGPPFRRIGPRMIRYRWGDVQAWLDDRAHASTSEYNGRAEA